MIPRHSSSHPSSSSSSRFALDKVADDLTLYNDGAIVYMYFENFITYDQCECYPGPYMNMIMGPNGSGKSSIVAAMVLGLGWHPSILGRSKDIAEYIKYGREKAIVEIGLKVGRKLEKIGDMRDDEVLLLRREITRQRGRHFSEWFINDCPSNTKIVMSVMRALNVQIDNLCQFLPQDKVSEFARLTPAELLAETEKAAAPGEVYEQHAKLIELRNKENNLVTVVEEQNRKLTSLSKQNENLESLIQRIQEREVHLKTIRLGERKKPWLLYNAARDAYLETKSIRDNARIELEKAEETFNPSKVMLKQTQESLRSAEKKRSKMNERAERMKDELDNILGKEMEKVTMDIAKFKSQIFKLREHRARRENSVVELKKFIEQLEEEIIARSQSEQPDEDYYRGELKKINDEIDEIENKIGESEEQAKGISREGERLQKDVDQISAELRQLDDIKVVKLETIRRMVPDVYEAYHWIQNHKREFTQPVYGPICLDIKLKDLTLSRQVESVISKGNLLNFVVTNANDLETFQRQLCDTMKFKVNVTLVEDLTINSGRTELDKVELKRLGFIGTVLDLLDAPAPVLAVLVDVAKIHMIPIAKNGIDHARTESIRGLQKYASADGCFEIKKSPYSDDVAVRCLSLKPNALFLGQAGGEERKHTLVNRIGEIRTELARNNDRMKRILQEKELLMKQHGIVKSGKDKISEQRRAILEEIAKVRRKRNLLDLKKDSLQKLLDLDHSREDIREEDDAKRQLKILYLKHADIVIKATDHLIRLKELVMSMGSEFVAIALIEGEIFRLNDEVQANEFRYESLRVTLNQVENELTKRKSIAKELLEMASKDELDDETKEAFAELPETLEELDRLLAIERTKAEIINDPSISANTLREFEQRKTTISELQGSIENLRSQIRELNNQMVTIQDHWLPVVERMIAAINMRFSAFFAQMQCAGEVRMVQEGRNYAAWSLEILVRFRDDEMLQILSAQRQSGGEKSVSTILFLLSLQELTQSPFRVVDEINQGMDANNERRVHSLVVENATHTSHSQYFLITPKLLTGLEYHEKMHVLCVFNGEGVPPLIPPISLK